MLLPCQTGIVCVCVCVCLCVSVRLLGDLLSMSRPRSLRSISVPISGDGWDLLEDSKDVVRLWRQLPSISDLPFARLLQWHQRQPMNQVTRTVHGLAQRLPLQGFEWSSYLDQRGRVVREADFRLRVFHGGVSGDLRPSAWRHILYVFPPHLTSDERETFLEKRRREYIELRNAWKNTECTPSIRSLMSTIDNDVIRTDRRNECFRDDDSPYLKSLFNILMTFALNDPVVSYVQGLNDIVAILLQVYGGDEVDTYIAFHGFMRCSRSLFTPEGLALKSGHLMALLQRFDSVFYDYLCHTKSEDLFFTYRWLLLDLKREFDQVDVMRLFEVLWSTLPPPSQYLTSLHSPSPEAAAAPGSRGLSPEAVVSVPPGQSAHGRSAGAEVTVREYGPASGDSWFVIDTLSPTVKESGVNEVSESRQRAISAVEEARDATNLSLTQSSVAHHGQAAVAADPDYKDSPVTAGATSVESSRTPSDWDVVDSTEIEIVGGGRRHVQPAARVEVDGDDTLVDIDAAEADVAPAPITESIVHSDPIEMNTGHAAVGSTQEARPSSSSQVSEEYSTYGSPLTMFVCLAILLEHRNAIMQDNLVQESIAIHFDKLRGRHDIGSILDKARTLLSDYVNSEVSTPPYSPPDASVLLWETWRVMVLLFISVLSPGPLSQHYEKIYVWVWSVLAGENCGSVWYWWTRTGRVRCSPVHCVASLPCGLFHCMKQ